jgi:hypothetical protein
LTNQGPTYYLDRPHVRVRDAEFLRGTDRLSSLVTSGKYTHILVHGQTYLEPLVAALGPRVRKLWSEDVAVPVSRSFGGTFTAPAALFEVVR